MKLRMFLAMLIGALLIGAKPRNPTWREPTCSTSTGKIFAQHGKALNDVASPNVKVLVVDNPWNTNVLIFMKNARHLKFPFNFHAITR